MKTYDARKFAGLTDVPTSTYQANHIFSIPYKDDEGDSPTETDRKAREFLEKRFQELN